MIYRLIVAVLKLITFVGKRLLYCMIIAMMCVIVKNAPIQNPS